MKILLVTEYFFPKSTGGTELYVYNLARELLNFGNQVAILTCVHNSLNYEFNGIEVIAIPFNTDQDTRVIKEEIPADNLAYYTKAITDYHPDVIHFHTLTTSIGFFHIKNSVALNYKVVLTSHIPGHICLRGDLVYMNKEVCDGIIESQKCLSCYHNRLEIISPFNQITAAMLKFCGYIFPSVDTAKNKKNELLKLTEMLSAVIVVSGWQKEMFLANGIEPTKLSICRQAVFKSYNHIERPPNKVLTIGFISRISKGKGLHLLLKALEAISPDLYILKVAAIAVPDEMAYFLAMKEKASKFSNIIWAENLPNEEIDNFMSTLDVLCIPSIWLETGPFVAYEAMANGIPVLGSNSGGINELIVNDENGWLFDFNNAEDLTRQLNKLIQMFTKDQVLPFKNINMRTSKDMANEMMITYQQILK